MQGTCTWPTCSGTGPLVPWSGERLCWDCTDRQLNMLARQCQLMPVTIGKGVQTPGHVQTVRVGDSDA